jgi:hypothetical protein
MLALRHGALGMVDICLGPGGRAYPKTSISKREVERWRENPSLSYIV